MSSELANFLASELGNGRIRAMFGGWGVDVDGEMVAIVYEGRTYLKATTTAAQERFIDAGMGPFRPQATRTFRTYWELPPGVIDDANGLAPWLALVECSGSDRRTDRRRLEADSAIS